MHELEEVVGGREKEMGRCEEEGRAVRDEEEVVCVEAAGGGEAEDDFFVGDGGDFDEGAEFGEASEEAWRCMVRRGCVEAED